MPVKQEHVGSTPTTSIIERATMHSSDEELHFTRTYHCPACDCTGRELPCWQCGSRQLTLAFCWPGSIISPANTSIVPAGSMRPDRELF